jgi:hypothetical protein
MRNLCTVLTALFYVLFSVGRVVAQTPTVQTLVRAGHLLDPRTGQVLSHAAVLIENGKIKEVGSPTQVQAHAPGVKTIDLGRATLLPGLIDSHTHLLLDVVVPPEAEIARHLNGKFAPGMLLAIVESPTKRVLMGAQLAREDLESGITTARNLGHSGVDGDTELRDAINASRVPGPRILASERKLITRGEYVQNLNPALDDAILQEEFLLIDGADRARQGNHGVGHLGTKPADTPEHMKYEQETTLAQARWLGLSSNARQIFARHSSEYIQFDEPEIVINAIREVYDHARRPLAVHGD